MSATITCSVCGHSASISSSLVGRKLRCPSCDTPVMAAPAAPPATAPAELQQPAPPQAGKAPPSSQIVAASRTVIAQTEVMIRYSCPRCKQSLESPASQGGTKLNCPACGQRLQIPQSPVAPALAPLNQTVLAVAASAVQPDEPRSPVDQVEILPDEALLVRCFECGRSCREGRVVRMERKVARSSGVGGGLSREWGSGGRGAWHVGLFEQSHYAVVDVCERCAARIEAAERQRKETAKKTAITAAMIAGAVILVAILGTLIASQFTR